MSQAASETAGQERITILSKDFTPAAMEFHRRRMGEQGYAIDGPIVLKRLFHVDGPGAPEALLDGEEHYAVTFIRARPAAEV